MKNQTDNATAIDNLIDLAQRVAVNFSNTPTGKKMRGAINPAVNEYDALKSLAEACSSYPDYALPSRINEALAALAAVRTGGDK